MAEAAAAEPVAEKPAAKAAPKAEAAPAEEAPAPAKPRAKKAAKGDDLTLIEGIGPKMAAALVAAGIDTFAKLSEASEDALRNAIHQAGMNLAPSIPTWAKQAKFAADGDMDGLTAYKDHLVGGREPE